MNKLNRVYTLLNNTKKEACIYEELNGWNVATTTLGLICALIGTLIFSLGVNSITETFNLEFIVGITSFAGGILILILLVANVNTRILAVDLDTRKKALTEGKLLFSAAFLFFIVTILTAGKTIPIDWYIPTSFIILIIYFIKSLNAIRTGSSPSPKA